MGCLDNIFAPDCRWGQASLISGGPKILPGGAGPPAPALPPPRLRLWFDPRFRDLSEITRGGGWCRKGEGLIFSALQKGGSLKTEPLKREGHKNLNHNFHKGSRVGQKYNTHVTTKDHDF
jgi:hypothetical protein